jgi:DNA-binding MarR family transcriptional regulator
MPDAAGGGLPLEEHIGVALRRAYQHAVANLTERIAPFELSAMQFSVLVRLRDQGPHTQNSLGRSIFMEPANIRELVRRLEGRGLLRRDPDPGDRRAVVVSITPAGLAVLEAARGEADAANAGTLAALSVREREQLFGLLGRLVSPD